MQAQCVMMGRTEPGYTLFVGKPCFVDREMKIAHCEPIVADMNGDLPAIWFPPEPQDPHLSGDQPKP